MRIIGGKFKGRTIAPPRNLRARPTTDFAKENLFNVLAGMVDLEECDVLDLFAGTGSVSYEFASRGARSVTAVEINAVHYEFIRRTAAGLGLNKFFPVKANVFNYLRACTRRFDVIFSDAPYDLKGSEEVIALVFERGLLRGAGARRDDGSAVVATSVSASTPTPDEVAGGATGKTAASGGAVDEIVDADDEGTGGGLLIFEHSKEQDFSKHPRFLQTRSYGSVRFTFFGAGNEI